MLPHLFSFSQLILGLLVIMLAQPQAAAGRESLSGTWKEASSETIYSVEQWGERCGVAPQSKGRASRGLDFSVEDRGIDLLFKSPTETFSAAACQSASPEIKFKEHTLKDDLFLTNCATPETTKNYESGLYSFRIRSANEILYRETTRFSRNLEGVLCIHTRRTLRTYIRLAGAPTASPEKPESGAAEKPSPSPDPTTVQPTAVPPRTPEDPCKTPGPPVRLSLMPARAALPPGEKICPQAQFTDARGCATQSKLALGPTTPPAGVALTPEGCLLVSDRIRSGTRRVQLSGGQATAYFDLTVTKISVAISKTSPHPAAELVPPPENPVVESSAPSPPALPAADTALPSEAPSGSTSTSPLSTIETQTKPADSGPPWVLLGGILGGVLLIASVLFFLWRKRQAKVAPATPPATAGVPIAQASSSTPAQQRHALEGPPTVSKPATVFCTTCGRAIPAEAKFCPFDRTPVHHPGSPTLPSSPVCPACKRLLPTGAKFCPFDRTKLS